MTQRHTIALALGHAREVVHCRLSGLSAMADRKIQGMEVGVLTHALAALVGRKRSEKESHGLPVLLSHDGRPGWRTEHVTVLLTLVFPPRVTGVEGLQPRLEQRAFFSRPDAVGSQDCELVATVFLAHAAHEVLAIVTLRQSGGGRQSEGKGSEGAGHVLDICLTVRGQIA